MCNMKAVTVGLKSTGKPCPYRVWSDFAGMRESSSWKQLWKYPPGKVPIAGLSEQVPPGTQCQWQGPQPLFLHYWGSLGSGVLARPAYGKNPRHGRPSSSGSERGWTVFPISLAGPVALPKLLEGQFFSLAK